ncbi:hypothetical protein [Lactobacillus terrae]|uniref:hypothetical protein n=1 Tax=Lactobacillus terrae TaxID=2269374 RepID=UPI000C1B6695|nr:hypothetical protein [Lactobacillus terrae]
MNIVLLLLIVYFIKKQFEFEKTKRIYLLIIPVYSIIMFIFSFKPSVSNNLYLLVILVISAIVSYIQAKHTETITLPDKDKYNRPATEIKGGYVYLLGWIVIFIAELILIWFKVGRLNILETLSEEITLDLFKFKHFGNDSSWFILALSGFSSYFYSLWLRLFNPDIKKSLNRRKNQSIK